MEAGELPAVVRSRRPTRAQAQRSGYGGAAARRENTAAPARRRGTTRAASRGCSKLRASARSPATLGAAGVAMSRPLPAPAASLARTPARWRSLRRRPAARQKFLSWPCQPGDDKDVLAEVGRTRDAATPEDSPHGSVDARESFGTPLLRCGLRPCDRPTPRTTRQGSTHDDRADSAPSCTRRCGRGHRHRRNALRALSRPQRRR